MKKLLSLLFCFRITNITRCDSSESSKLNGMSDEAYKVRLKVLKITDNSLAGDNSADVSISQDIIRIKY
ncbi:hypothetical protein [Thomasclavelia cocleata]|uniref:Uncharacterized protein n=1 Tax=Thomasclavelia cocleata TaxID=69824 RepID=A0A829ZD34_9FIRM|nr:hypothetical protein [Thomasclavelia cocleata]GFI42303.1 hypothetical protein IMSAGC017_02350 [Thomasclavelia cocleata]